MITRRSASTLILSAAAGAFAGRVAFAQDKKIRVAFANYSDEAVFGAAVLRGFHNAEKKHPDMEVRYFDNKQDPAKTIENARTIVASKPDVVIWYTTFADVNKRAGALFAEAKLAAIAV